MEPQTAAPSRLVRRRDGRMIAGVCKGIADHFGIDSVLVRIGFVVAAFFGGAGLIAYGAAWAFIPEEGERTSVGERIVRERRWGRIAGIVLIAIALSSLGRPFWWVGGHVVFAVLLILGGLFLLTTPRFSDDDEPPAPDPTPVAPDPASAPTAMPPTSPAMPTSSAATPPPPSGPTTALLDAPVPPPPPPPPVRTRSRRRGGLGALTFGVLFIGAGIVGLLLASGTSVEPAYVFGIGLLVVGAALVVSTWIGRSVVLIPLGVLLVVLLSVSTVIDVPITGGIGDRRVQPLSVTDLKSEYHLGIGELRLDLTKIGLERGSVHTVKATVGIGHLLVLLPRNVTAELHGHAGMGEVRFLDDHDGGVRVDRDTALPAAGENPPRVVLDLEVGVGQVEVTDATS